MLLETLPYDCKLSVLNHLTPREIINLQQAFPAWKSACSFEKLWDIKIREQQFQAPEINSEMCLKVSNRDQCFLLQAKTDDYFKDLDNWKTTKPNNPQKRGIINKVYTKFSKKDKLPEIIFRGPGMETKINGSKNNMVTDLMWGRASILKTEGADQHGGITMKYTKGVFLQQFVLKFLYSGNSALRTQNDNVGRANNMGVFDRETGSFTFSRQVISKVRKSNKFVYILNQNEGLVDIDETIGELRGYVTNGMAGSNAFEENGVLGGKKNTKLVILLMSLRGRDKLYNVLDVVKELKLNWLEDQARIFDNADLEWKVCGGDYDDFDTLDVALQWVLS